MSEHYDAIIVGAGLSGEACARRLCSRGLRVALVEREHIAGKSTRWITIPSESALGPGHDFWHPGVGRDVEPKAVQRPAPVVLQGHPQPCQEDVAQIKRLTSEGITVLWGNAHITGPRTVRVARKVLKTDRIIIATGMVPRVPDIEGLEEVGYWTKREAMACQSLPERIVVLGDGTESIALAQRFHSCGSEVTIVTSSDRLLPDEDPAVGQLLYQLCWDRGIRVVLGRSVQRIERASEGIRVMTLDDGSCVRVQQVLLAGGCAPQIAGLGLENTAVSMSGHGIQVDEYCRAARGIWAIGDVTGIGYFPQVALYQACVAADDILGQSHPAQYSSVPRIALTDPQFAATGLTLAEAQRQGLRINSITVDLVPSVRASALGMDIGGTLTLHEDRDRGVLVGAWAIAPGAEEWIELAVLAIRAGIPVTTLHEACERYGIFSEVYLHALDQLRAADQEKFSVSITLE